MKNSKKIALLLVMGVVTMGYIANSIGAAKTKTPAITSKMINDKKATFDEFLNEGKLAEAQNIANELSKVSGQRNTVDAMQKKLNSALSKKNNELNQTISQLSTKCAGQENLTNNLTKGVNDLNNQLESCYKEKSDAVIEAKTYGKALEKIYTAMNIKNDPSDRDIFVSLADKVIKKYEDQKSNYNNLLQDIKDILDKKDADDTTITSIKDSIDGLYIIP